MSIFSKLLYRLSRYKLLPPSSNLTLFIFSSAVSSGFYLFCFGTSSLNPSSINWIISNPADLNDHFVGWLFFLNEKWNFPIIGKIENYFYPHGTSIVYVDCIPLLAILFKIISPIIGSPFQYFGIWYLLSFTLQIFFATKLLVYLTNKTVQSYLGSLFFLLAPFMIIRLGGHSALVGQWLIIAAIYLYLTNSKNIHFLLPISIAIHFYLFIFVFAIWLLTLLHKLSIQEIRKAIYLLAFVTITAYLLGYFILKASDLRGGRFYNANILSFIDPYFVYVSKFIKPIKKVGTFQYEGFGYLGIGILTLLPIALIWRKTKLPSTFLLLTLIGTLFFIFSIIPNIYIGEHLITTLILPEKTLAHLQVVRANGRFIWLACYLIYIFVIVSVIQNFPPVVSTVFLSTALVLQTIDISPHIAKKARLLNLKPHGSLFNKEKWQDIVDKIDTVIFFPPVTRGYSDLIHTQLATIVASRGKKINVGNVARYSKEAREKYHKQLKKEITNSSIDPQSIYIIEDFHLLRKLQKRDNFKKVLLNGLYLIVPHKIANNLDNWPNILDEIQIVKKHFKKGEIVLLAVNRNQSNHNLLKFLKNFNTTATQNNMIPYLAIFEDGVLLKEKYGKSKLHIYYRKNKFFCRLKAKSRERVALLINGYDLTFIHPSKGIHLVVLNYKQNKIYRYLIKNFPHIE